MKLPTVEQIAYLTTKPGMEYLPKLPKLPQQIAPDRYLVHNHVYPVANRPGVRGSRMWYQTDRSGLEVCPCGWKPELGLHYRVILPR